MTFHVRGWESACLPHWEETSPHHLGSGTTVKAMSLTLPARGRAVLSHLLTDRYGGHTVASTAAATGLGHAAVTSTFTLLVTCGWAVWRDDGAGRVLALTSIGRAEGPGAVVAGVPLRQLDAEDPRLADRVRRQLGWAARHVTA